MKKYSITINGQKQTIEASNLKAAIKHAIKTLSLPKDSLYNELHIDLWIQREE